MRGEHVVERRSRRGFKGSSPHARGTLRRGSIVGDLRGIIPACAGNTPRPSPQDLTLWDHPRMRGEHPVEDDTRRIRQGSSPHARGTHDAVRHVGPVDGIIPACAGNTHAMRSAPRFSRDHPRMRGEHVKSRRVIHVRTGSSPHARGTPRTVRQNRLSAGIIPACAGNTINIGVPLPLTRDHPRMRGEHFPQCKPEVKKSGSSPHARGTQ